MVSPRDGILSGPKNEPDIVVAGDYHYDPETGDLDLMVAATLQKTAIRNLRFSPHAKKLFSNIVQTSAVAMHKLLMQGLQQASLSPALPVSGGNGDEPIESEALPEQMPSALQLDLFASGDASGPDAPGEETPADHSTNGQDPDPTADSPL